MLLRRSLSEGPVFRFEAPPQVIHGKFSTPFPSAGLSEAGLWAPFLSLLLTRGTALAGQLSSPLCLSFPVAQKGGVEQTTHSLSYDVNTRLSPTYAGI